MTSRKWKLKRKIEQNPKNVSFNDLETLLESFGFTVRKGKGSHHVFKRPGCYPLTVPFNRPVKSVYVKKALKYINDLIAQGEIDD
jgi:predicted RNA binding protein YcfA (HicA-like mRNA interferase family)